MPLDPEFWTEPDVAPETQPEIQPEPKPEPQTPKTDWLNLSPGARHPVGTPVRTHKCKIEPMWSHARLTTRQWDTTGTIMSLGLLGQNSAHPEVDPNFDRLGYYIVKHADGSIGYYVHKELLRTA